MAYGKGNLGGKSKLKFWETPLNFTQTVNINYTDTSHPNCRFAYKDLTIFQPYNRADFNIYYKELFIIQQGTGRDLAYHFSQIYIDDDYNIYVLTRSKIFSFLFSEKYSQRHELDAIYDDNMGNINFEFNNSIYFIAQKVINGSYRMVLLKYNKPSNKIISQPPVETALEKTINYQMDLFISGEDAFYYDNRTGNAIQKINLNTMQHGSKINLTKPSDINLYAYLGYYNNHHYIIGSNNNKYMYYIEYSNLGGTPTDYGQITLDSNIFNQFTTLPNIYNLSGTVIQASDNIVVTLGSRANAYNDMICYIDLKTKKIIKYVEYLGTSINLIGTIKKQVGYQAYRSGLYQQFYIE